MDDILTRYRLRQSTPMGDPYFSGPEVIDDLIRAFNQMPPQYTTDPTTGQTIVQRNMERPMGPPYLEPPYQPYFRSPNNPNWNFNMPPLSSSWILPEGAMEGPTFSDRSPPTSDASRQMAELTGVSNVGPEMSTLNPQTHWPESMFRVPIRESNVADPYAGPEPVFGSVTDFSRQRFHVPPIPGACLLYTSPSPRDRS